MAFPLLAIGATLAHGRAASSHGLHAKNLLKDVSFGLQLQQKLDAIGTDNSDLLSQLAGLLPAGTPLANTIDRVAKAVSDALASATGNEGNTDRRRTLQRALAAALAPPGASPPGTSLERRLGDLLSKISRELQKAGQQNRFSGAVLDANSAREIPAQRQTKESAGTHNAPDGSLAFVHSILQKAVQQLQHEGASQPQQITAQAPDVLGRMLARAASADAQRTQPLSASAAPAVSVHSTPVHSPSASPSELFARLMNVIAQNSNGGASHGGDKDASGFAFAKSVLPTVHHAQAPANTTPAAAFATAVSAATAPAAASQTPATAPYTIDPQSVIEQVVKGIVVRNSGTTSEVRMRLQPEHLGDVSLKLTVTGNTISASIIAQNANVRDMLMNNQQQLARSLAEAGLSLGAFSVDVSGGNPGFSQQQTQQQRSLAKAGALHASALSEDDTWADSRFGPPVLTGSKSLVLNYLA